MEASNPPSPQKQEPTDTYKYTIILDKLSGDITVEDITSVLTTASVKFNKVENIKSEEFSKFGIESPLNRNSRH
jgi:ribosome maturation factor RimP